MRHLLERLAQAVIIATLVLTGSWAAPKIDGLFFPVVTDLDVTAVEDPANPGSSLVQGTYIRLRDCTFIRTDWYYGSIGSRAIRVTSIRLDAPRLPPRLNDRLPWGPTRLFVTPEQVASNVFAVAVHDCYNGLLWDTETLIYNASK